MMLLGKLFCLLSVVTSAQVTWNPVMGWWRFAFDIFQEKWPVMLPSWTMKEADRFSGLANTLGRICAVKRHGKKLSQTLSTIWSNTVLVYFEIPKSHTDSCHVYFYIQFTEDPDNFLPFLNQSKSYFIWILDKIPSSKPGPLG